MGSIGAMNSIERVIDMKKKELTDIASEVLGSYSLPEEVSIIPDFTMNDLFEGVDILWYVTINHPESGVPLNFSIPGPLMDFDFLADEFPDCEMGR